MHADPSRALELIEPAWRPERPELRDGYLDLLGDEDPTGGGPGQRLMVSRPLPLIYERIWRPLGGRVLMGALGPPLRGDEVERARQSVMPWPEPNCAVFGGSAPSSLEPARSDVPADMSSRGSRGGRPSR